MADIETEFERLMGASRVGRFDGAVAATSLASVEARIHPLNFVALKSDSRAGRALRLHLWNEAFNFGQAGFEVHDHVFDIDAFIVHGKLRQTIYEAVPDPSGTCEVFRVSYSSGGSDLMSTNDRRALRVLSEEVFCEGDRYQLKSGVLHRLTLLTKSAATLVLTFPRAGAPITIGPHGSGLSRSAERSVICDAEGRPMTIASAGIASIVATAAGQ